MMALPPVRAKAHFGIDDASAMNRHWWTMEYLAARPCRCASWYQCQFCLARVSLAELRNSLGEE